MDLEKIIFFVQIDDLEESQEYANNENRFSIDWEFWLISEILCGFNNAYHLQPIIKVVIQLLFTTTRETDRQTDILLVMFCKKLELDNQISEKSENDQLFL